MSKSLKIKTAGVSSKNHPHTLQKYKVRPGTTDSGRLYEAKMTALICLRCVNADTKDMLIASNADDIGDFDDIVLLKESPGGSCVAYMVQLKHQDNPKDLKPADFISNLTKSKDFKLSKYSQSFQMLKSKIEKSAEGENDFIKRLRKVDRIIFVLFTNKDVGECTFLKRHQDRDFSFLQTGDLNSDLYGFDCTQLEDYSPEFLESIFLLSKQSTVEGLDVLIKNEIGKIVNPLKLIDEDLTSVSNNFVTFIKAWVQSKLDEQYILTKQDIISKLTSLLLERFKITLADNLSNSVQIDIFHDVCCAHILTIVDWDEKVFRFLVRYLAGQLENFCGRNESMVNRKKQEKKYWGTTFQHWGNNLRQQLKNWLYDNHADFKEHMIKFEGNPENVTFSDIYHYLWLTHQLPLLLKVNTIGEFESILRILEFSKFTFQAILLNRTGKKLPKTDATLKRFETMEDLNEYDKKNLLDQKVKLQGRTLVLLEDIVDDSMFQYLTSYEIINILLDDFNIGNVHEAPTDYLIERSIYRVLIAPSALENINNELFLIEKQPKLVLSLVDLTRIVKVGDISSSNLNEKNIIIAECHDDFNETQIKNLYKSSKKTIHWLLYHEPNQLEWKKTFGSTKNIKLYRLEELDDYESQLTYTTDEMFLLPNSTNILSASPGMGKSTLMDCLAHRTPKDVWILNINLNQHETYYDSEECQNCETPAVVHLNYFNKKILEKHCCNTKLAEAVFQKMLKTKKVLVLLDGFDEISIFFKDEVTNIAKCLQREGFKVWITTRPIMKVHLEEELNVISTTLKPFTVEDQEEFLLKYFSSVDASKALTSEDREMMNKFIEELLDTAALNLNDRDREFMGIPLQIKLLAEAFNADCLKSIKTGIIKFNKSFDLLDLYENFVKTKTNILCAKHGLREKKEFERHKEYQYFSALKVLFKHRLLQKLNIDEKLQRCEEFLGESFFQKGGIMVAKNEFVHRTYPEYLSAKWLAENLYHKDDKVYKTVKDLLNERFNQQYKFLFNVFDRIVCEGCDVHLCVINGQLERAIESVTSSMNSITLEDKLGRSLLHIVALYGEFSPSQTFYEYLIKLNKDTKNNIAKLVELVLNYEVISTKDDKLGCSPLDYAIANGSLEAANKMCAYSKKMNIKVILSQELKAKYFLYCAKMNYRFLFERLLRYFSYITLINVDNELLDEYCIESCQKLQPQMTDEILRKLKSYIKKYDVADLTDLYILKSKSVFKHSRMYFDDLHIATVFSDWDNVDLLINDGNEIDKQDIFLKTALHYAALYNKPDMVTFLLEKGAQINKSDKEGNTPLHYAVKEKLLDITDVLLEKEAKFNIKNKEDRTALEMAVESNSKDLKSLFLKRGFMEEATTDSIPWEENTLDIIVDDKIIDVLIDCAFQQTSKVSNNSAINDDQLSYDRKLYEAVAEDDLLKFKKNVSRGGNINIQNHLGDTVLHWAVRQKNVEAVKLLLSHKADVNIANSEGDTPLLCSVIREDLDDITLLLLSSVEEKENSKSSPRMFNGNETISSIYTENYDAAITSNMIEVNKQNIHQQCPLILATRRGKANIVKLLISRGANTNITDGMENTALHHAAMYGLQEIISELLCAGAEINIQNADENTALHLAASKGYTDVVTLLLARRADVNILGFNGNTALHDAAKFGSKEILSALLEAGAEIDKRNHFSTAPLHIATEKNHLDAVTVLLANGADVNSFNSLRNTAVHIATKFGLQKIVLVLVDGGAEVNKQNAENNTPLHVAALQGHLEIVKLLLNRGADCNIVGFRNNTALHNAAKSGSQDVVARTLAAGALINERNLKGETSLHVAVSENHLGVAKLLLAKFSDFHIFDCSGKTALHVAVMSGAEDMVSALLDAGADINKQNVEEKTPLHLAASNGHLDVVQLLLAEGADINICDHSRDTPLHNAAQFGSQEIVSTLLNAGIGINIQNASNLTPLHSAILKKRLDVVKLLLAKGADVNIQGFEENTALHFAALHNAEEIILELFRAGAEINSQNALKKTPLHLAVSEGCLKSVMLLIDNGADVHILDSSGNVALNI